MTSNRIVVFITAMLTGFCLKSNGLIINKLNRARYSTSFLNMNNANKDTLYDVPVSNHGARVRMIVYSKGLDDQVQLVNPSELGGLKSTEFLELNMQGKMPVLVTADGWAIPESDTISRYLIDKFAEKAPSYVPATREQRTLSEQISRTHDMYISLVQGAMYKAPGTPFSIYGQDRGAALFELKKQFLGIEKTLEKFSKQYPSLRGGPYLCGQEVSLADVTLFPTAVFAMFMLPEFFKWKVEGFMGKRLMAWYDFMSTKDTVGKRVKEEIEAALVQWKANGRWDPIVADMNK